MSAEKAMMTNINNDTQEVKLLSLYRDTYLELCNDSQSYEKAAHAYAYGGAQGAVNMINKNLDLNITVVSQYLRTGYVNREHWVLVLPREGMVMDPDRTLKSYHVENGDKLILM